jgi:hypothetical protein
MQPLIIKAGMSSTPALENPNQKQELKIRIQKMTKGWGRQQDKECCIPTENL